MPFDLRKFRENNKQELSDEHKQLFESLHGGMNRTALGAQFSAHSEMAYNVMGLVHSMYKLRFPPSGDMNKYDEEQIEEINEEYTGILNKFSGFAEYLKEDKNMKVFVEVCNNDPESPTLGKDGQLMADLFTFCNDVYGTRIDVEGFKNSYKKTAQLLIKPEEKSDEEKKEEEKLIEQAIDLGIQPVNEKKLSEEIKEENKEEKKEEIININEIEIDDKPLNINAEQNKPSIAKEHKNRKKYQHDRALTDVNEISLGLYAKHNNNSIFRIGTASPELSRVRSAFTTYDRYMRDPGHPKFKGVDEFSLLKTLMENSNTYRRLKKEHGKGDTSKPDWEPGTNMGKLRYRAAGKMADFAKNRMKDIVAEYSIDHGISKEEAYKHFDPENKLNLFPGIGVKKVPVKVDLDKTITDSKTNLINAKEKLAFDEAPDPKQHYNDYLNITTAYYIKSKGKVKKEVTDTLFEQAKKYIGSSYEFNDILMKGDASELYQKATRDKGQDLWSHFDGIRQKTKALKESVKSDNKTLGTEFGKAATVLGNNGK